MTGKSVAGDCGPGDCAVERAARALAALLEKGLPQDRGVLDYAFATHGVTDADGLAALLRDRDEACAGPLFRLMLSPGESTREAVEPLLAELRLDAAQARALGMRLSALAGEAVFLSPDGTRLTVRLEPGDAAAFAADLRPQANAPERIDRLLADAYDEPAGRTLRVGLRRLGVAWTDARETFVAGVLAGLAHAPALARPTLEWALCFLGTVRPEADLETALAARRRALSVLLSRARMQDAMLAKHNFETLALQGASLLNLHAPDLRRELALLDRAASAAGLDAGRGETVLEEDLGDCRDPETLVKLLGG